ncbi:MAB_1171c family putative transporter [Paractinoplanes globisporus]|uniref:MAB_1171c family putative transporter n=1 Tax=Paractinoplanes globisporus TaxID=113565 RepID=A0ABW6WT25_9ACTN|nr:MAB_1171c family putative transporter [Actinoplanes globisporus]
MTFDVGLLAFLWGATVARLPTLLRDRRQQAMWATLFAGTLTETSTFPPLARAIGWPILTHLLGAISAFVLLRFLALLSGVRVRPWQVALTVAVVVTLVTLDLTTGGIDPSPARLSGHLTPPMVAYWVVLEGFLGAILVSSVMLFWSVARDAPAGLPRLGLRTIAVGTAMIVVYAAVKTILIVLRGAGVPIDFETVAGPGRALQGAGTLLAVAGALVPAGRKARSVFAAYRSLLALRPLWTAMRDAFPEVILFTPRRAVFELSGVDDVHLRLYRRVIEIRDGMLALRPYLQGISPGTPEAEAAAIAEALRRHAEGIAPSAETAGFAPVGPEMADEVAWLSRVSRAYHRRAVTPETAPTPRPSESAR